MKLKNKKTGEIREIKNILIDGMFSINSLAELNEEWEDYEEPKDYWFIDSGGEVGEETYLTDRDRTNLRNFGNYFETREEAQKAVEKLKAWKRLKEAGFEFGGWTHTPITKSLTGYNLHIKAYSDKLADYMDDLQLLFGGEE